MKLMLRLIVLLPVLAFAMSISASPARAADPVHITHARKFLQAFDSKDAGTMAIIAAQTSRKVPYALVIFSLLESREFEAARRLANLRAGAPEGKGLGLLCEGYVSGVRSNEEERARYRNAETYLRAGKATEALAALGKPHGTEGTVTGARLDWTRARALVALLRHMA